MAKTTQGISPRKAKLEMVVSAAMVTAIAALSTAETVDLSSCIKGTDGGGLTRVVEKEWVIGDDEAITTYDTRLTRGDLNVVGLYTNGKETLGTDTFDLYSVLKSLAEYTASDLSVQFIWSPAGGAVGDAEYTTDATESFIASLSDPVGGVETTGKQQFTMAISSPSLAESTVT